MINLLPPKRLLNMKVARNNTILKRYIELTLLSMLLIVVAIAASYYFLSSQQKSVKNTLEIDQKKVAELSPIQKEAEELSATINTISGLLSRNVKFSEMLTKIGSVMPSGAVLTGLQFSIEDLDAPLVVSAQVETEERAAVLRNNLATSDLFKGAEIKSILLNEESESNGSTSTLNSPLTPATPSNSSANSKYRYTATIDAYFKDLGSTTP